MGGLFSAPKPVVVPPPAPPPASPAPAPPAVAAEAARIESRGRGRGGLAGTIATSAVGVLAPIPVSRKSLLGE